MQVPVQLAARWTQNTLGVPSQHLLQKGRLPARPTPPSVGGIALAGRHDGGDFFGACKNINIINYNGFNLHDKQVQLKL